MFSIGLQILAHLLLTIALAGDSDGDDDYTPALPSDLTASHAAGPSLPSKSESNTYTLPPKRHYPQPLPTAYASQIEGKSGVEEFLEREERRRKLQEQANRLKKLQREEWMLVFPKSGDLLTFILHLTRRKPDLRIHRERRTCVTQQSDGDGIKIFAEELRSTCKARGSAPVESHLEREKEEKKRKQSVDGLWMINRGRRCFGVPKDSQSISVRSELTLVVKTSAISSGTIVASKSSTRVSEQCAIGFQIMSPSTLSSALLAVAAITIVHAQPDPADPPYQVDYHTAALRGPQPNSTIGDTEGQEVAWCTKPGHGTRLIPAGALQGVQLIKTPNYIQIAGFIDQTQVNIAANDYGGELDPYGADLRGNPLGGLTYSNAFPSNDDNNDSYHQVIDWTNFMGGTGFCIKVCDPAGQNQQALCQNIYDHLGCAYNAQKSVFEVCDGDDMFPVGVYTTNGATSTYFQPPESLGPITTYVAVHRAADAIRRDREFRCKWSKVNSEWHTSPAIGRGLPGWGPAVVPSVSGSVGGSRGGSLFVPVQSPAARPRLSVRGLATSSGRDPGPNARKSWTRLASDRGNFWPEIDVVPLVPLSPSMVSWHPLVAFQAACGRNTRKCEIQKSKSKNPKKQMAGI
ncbi:uncharacterized protein HD556DRAFT_1309368 [Suillus plorans]|uniref:Uncharacterized protein n=1 Tax=Suillus plorans TaxID=116603 RepID=A0A9P7AM61_9AGAM|nr:uncharacterized protein HD556DRAFT_1309368 [Suillus plorans]KAG1792293.1 hypothetical protein HD556DRAFT_1309368 [Suillus plorans]